MLRWHSELVPDVRVVDVDGVVNVKLGIADQKCVRESGHGFVVVEGVHGQELGDVDVDEDDVAVGVKCCLEMIFLKMKQIC